MHLHVSSLVQVNEGKGRSKFVSKKSYGSPLLLLCISCYTLPVRRLCFVSRFLEERRQKTAGNCVKFSEISKCHHKERVGQEIACGASGGVPCRRSMKVGAEWGAWRCAAMMGIGVGFWARNGKRACRGG